MADDRREALLVANRLTQLAESPIHGRFNLSHLQAVHVHIFHDLPHHRPGELRGETPGWSKFRALENQVSVHEVHYAHDNIGPRADAMLRDLGEPTGIASLPPEAVPARLARLYSRTLREFTRSLADAADYELNWSSTNVTAAARNRLYVARDIAVLERAFPGLTPRRGMETNDRAEFEALLALPALRRVPPRGSTGPAHCSAPRHRVDGGADRPEPQNPIIGWTQQSGHVALGFTEPERPVPLLQDSRHPVVHTQHVPVT